MKLTNLALCVIYWYFPTLGVSGQEREHVNPSATYAQKSSPQLAAAATDLTIPIYGQIQSQGIKQSILTHLIHARHRNGLVLKDVTIVEFSPTKLKSLTFAKSMSWDYQKLAWMASNGKKYQFGTTKNNIAKVADFSTQQLQVRLVPKQISSFRTSDLPSSEIFQSEYIEIIRADGAREKVLRKLWLGHKRSSQLSPLQRIIIIDFSEREQTQPKSILFAELASFDLTNNIWNLRKGLEYLFDDKSKINLVSFDRLQIQLPK
ncbi:LptF/LptG family permease [Chamaesiphon sp. VAR_48_metabat_403]|uniref:LptF/LptG family permease n=1 Tax=Chamaesiphon sp. VAR_48_metabat_403 TaxID=2964700 RepID=UPI00286E9B34|nr:LptF/LptG family permease [Chamaesiphon sp. VAR_48_metabat_403]